MNFKHWLLLSETKKAGEIANEIIYSSIVDKNKIQDEKYQEILKKKQEDVINKLKSIIPTDIKQDLQVKLLPIIAYYYQQEHNLNILKEKLIDYVKLIKNNKMPVITVNDDLTINGEYKSYLHWSQIIDAKKYEDKILNVSITDNDFEDQELIEKSLDGKIKVYKSNSVGKCIILGQGETFCISQPGNTMFQNYRDTKNSTFYFVHDKNRTDALAIVVVDANDDGIEITDRKNQTGITMQDPYSSTPLRIESSPEIYFKYLREHGINTNVFVNIPQTPEEKLEEKKLGNRKTNLKWFKSLTSEEKSKYISRGHLLPKQQFDYIYNNNLKLFLVQYVKMGNYLGSYQIQKIANNKDLLDNYLHARIIMVSRFLQNLEDNQELLNYLDDFENSLNNSSDFISKEEYKYLNQKQKEKFYNIFDNNTFNQDKTYKTITKIALIFHDMPFVESMIQKNPTLVKTVFKNMPNVQDINTIENLIQKNPKQIRHIIERTAELNQIDIFKHLLENHFKDIEDFEENNSKFDSLSYSEFKKLQKKYNKYLEIKGNSLVKAAEKGSIDIVKYLIEDKKTNVPEDAIEKSIYSHNLNLVEYLFNKGGKINFRCLETAIKQNQPDIINFLIQKGAVISGSAIEAATTPEIKNFLLQKLKEKR